MKIAAIAVLGLTVGIVVAFVLTRKDPTPSDYNHRSSGGEQLVEVPQIGPYQASGNGDPPASYIVPTFEIPETVTNSLVVFQGTIEVEGGDSAPLTVRGVVSKSGESVRDGAMIDSCNLVFSKPRTIERKGKYSLSFRLPKVSRDYSLHIIHYDMNLDPLIVYGVAKFRAELNSE